MARARGAITARPYRCHGEPGGGDVGGDEQRRGAGAADAGRYPGGRAREALTGDNAYATLVRDDPGWPDHADRNSAEHHRFRNPGAATRRTVSDVRLRAGRHSLCGCRCDLRCLGGMAATAPGDARTAGRPGTLRTGNLPCRTQDRRGIEIGRNDARGNRGQAGQPGCHPDLTHSQRSGAAELCGLDEDPRRGCASRRDGGGEPGWLRQGTRTLVRRGGHRACRRGGGEAGSG